LVNIKTPVFAVGYLKH